MRELLEAAEAALKSRERSWPTPEEGRLAEVCRGIRKDPPASEEGARLRQALDLILEVTVDDRPCKYDDGRCLTHEWEEPCWMQRAKLFLAETWEGTKAEEPARFDMIAHLARQRLFSETTFGPGARTSGVVDHIRKELQEIEAQPADLSEWIDVVILALDGAWRAGHSPEAIVAALVAKQDKNEARRWPDWRTAAPGKAIEHDRSVDVANPTAPERY